jgi:hypothetical protein
MAISDVTRRAVLDELALSGVRWAGRLEDDEFLARLYDLSALPSTDRRFDNAAGDIWQHRVNNPEDWPDDWVFYDSRFGLMHGDDETFLKFLAETVHPVVRVDSEEAIKLAAAYNTHLLHDGYELIEVTKISGRPVYAAQSTLSVPTELREVERASPIANRGTLVQQITRMEAAIESDPELAIGTAKELIETCCKTILHARDITPDKSWKLPRLMRETASSLDLTPDGVPDSVAAAQTIKSVLGSLASIVGGVAELRNSYGTGHGRSPGQGGLQPRHARLAVGAAATLARFLFETYEFRTEHA